MLIPFQQIVKKYGKPNGILHVGANIGEEAEAYRNMGVYRQVWVEANVDLMPVLRANLHEPYEKAHCFVVGDEQDKEVQFHIANNGGQSSSILDLGTHLIQHPEVHYVETRTKIMKRIDQYFADGELEGIDFLNLDIQGAELKALRGMGDLLKQFRFVYSEVNRKYVYKDCALLPEMDEYLRRFGFRRVAIAPWIGDWTDALWIKK